MYTLTLFFEVEILHYLWFKILSIILLYQSPRQKKNCTDQVTHFRANYVKNLHTQCYTFDKGTYISKQCNILVTSGSNLRQEKAQICTQICTELDLHLLVKYYHVQSNLHYLDLDYPDFSIILTSFSGSSFS